MNPAKNQPNIQSTKPTTPVVKAELVSDIPVKSPNAANQTAPPPPQVQPTPRPRQTVIQPPEGDKDLDRILKEVNKSVKTEEQPQTIKPKPQHQTKSKEDNTLVPGPMQSHPKPIAVTLAACVAALILCIAAVAAFRQ